jgi:coenzyme F420-reducing hydrogenase delta subunit
MLWGAARLGYSNSLLGVRVPSTALVDLKLIAHAFVCGADGVMLFEADGTPQAKATEERLTLIRWFLRSRGIEEERVTFQPTLLPLFRVLGQQIDAYVKRVENLGKMKGKPVDRKMPEGQLNGVTTGDCMVDGGSRPVRKA